MRDEPTAASKRTSIWSPIFLALVLTLAFRITPTHLKAPATIVLLTRHAETRTGSSEDAVLSASGMRRASALGGALLGAGVTAIITTPSIQTRQTADSVAARLSVVPVSVPMNDGMASHATAVARMIRGKHLGGTVVVVESRDAILGIIAALGGPEVAAECPNEFGTLYTLVVEPGRPTRLVTSEYGAADVPGARDCHARAGSPRPLGIPAIPTEPSPAESHDSASPFLSFHH